MNSKLAGDTRAIANRIVIFGLIIITIALLMATLNPAFDRIGNETEQLADTQQANTGFAYVEQFWDFVPVVGLMLGVAMLIAGALYESGRRGV